jgi:hypothetical protein
MLTYADGHQIKRLTSELKQPLRYMRCNLRLLYSSFSVPLITSCVRACVRACIMHAACGVRAVRGLTFFLKTESKSVRACVRRAGDACNLGRGCGGGG